MSPTHVKLLPSFPRERESSVLHLRLLGPRVREDDNTEMRCLRHT